MKTFFTFANMSESIKTITEKAKQELNRIYSESEIKLLIRVIFDHLMEWDYTKIVMNYYDPLPNETYSKAIEIINRLASNEPIQYIIGYEYFMGNKFYVDNSTLIPRPETEELVKGIIEREHKSANAILDIGTGSGIIAISLAKHFTNATVSACDISSSAIKMAQQNAQHNNTKVNFIEMDILNWADYNIGKFDIIVSNPPYITEQEKSDMEQQVLEHEPHTALFVPNTEPLLFYKAIAEFGTKHLNCNGELWFEINRAYGKECCDMLQAMGYTNIELKKDQFDNDRVISAVWMS